MGTVPFYSTFLFLLMSLVIGQEESQKITFKISEQLQSGTYIGNIGAETNIGKDSGFRYQFVGTEVQLVNLNGTTGDLTTGKVIDREEECYFEAYCQVNFEVLATNSAALYSIEVSLIIEDINDNTPEFKNPQIWLNLSESRPINYEIPLTAAVDKDTGANNSVAVYEFSPFFPSLPNFAILNTTNPDGSLALSLKLVMELDREVKDTYQLIIFAKDAGVPVRTGTLTVNIRVLDENDNKPVFVDSVINVTVTEDITVGRVIVALQANDKDDDKNGEVEYQLAPQQAASIYEFFSIESKTGELKVAKMFDYDPNSAKKTIYIVARDQGTTPQSAQATVYLTILDAGNNPPQMVVTYLVPQIATNVISVLENATQNEAVVHVNVEDSDTGVNGNVTCQTYNTYFGIKEVSTSSNKKGFKVYVQHVLDRETNPEHNITVTCVDGGDLSSKVSFVIQLQDVNDNSPRFSTYIYNAEMKENNSYGAEVVRVTATDADDGENGRISFYIHPDNTDNFEVEENTGIVRARTRLDREALGQRVFKVLAVDNGSPRRTTTATVQLTLLDVNDVVPTFTESEMYDFEVFEHRPSGTLVNQVVAIDTDVGDNRLLRYFILPDYSTGGKFSVPFTVIEDGKIYTNMELDREAMSMYNFEVGVRDSGVPSLNSTVRIVVKVKDINDHKPVFIFPTNNNKTVVALNEVSDKPIGKVLAEDADVDMNERLLFFIAAGNDENIFEMNSSNGELFIHKYVHLTEDKVFSLRLSVFDKGSPPLNSTTDLIVILKYSNATYLDSTDSDTSKNYVVIVVTVVCITGLLSATIITVICLIRRKDKCGQTNGDKMKFPFGFNKQTQKGVPAQPLGTDRVYPEVVAPKFKKEVSFSLDEADSGSINSNDYKMLATKDKMFPSKQTPLDVTPEEGNIPSGTQSIMRGSQPFTHVQGTKYMDQQDMQLNVSHQREDSHSETSGETVTSHDSGKGGSLEGDHHDPRFELNQLNPSAYLIKDPQKYRAHAQPPNKPVPPKPQTLSLTRASDCNKLSVHYSDHNVPSNGTHQNRVRNWCQNQRINSTGSSYQDLNFSSSLGSNHNYGLAPKNNYLDPQLKWMHHPHNSSKLSPSGVVNHGYDNLYPTFRTNSTRDDDETTTTSGSYTINDEDIDEDVRMAQYRHRVSMDV